MQIKIINEQPFQVLSSNFTIGPSSSGYDLMFSADGVEYSKLFTVGANTNRQVTQVAAGSYYFLSGNTDTVTVNWMKDCGGGSGGGSYVLPVASENTLGGVKIGSGLTMSGDTLNANPGGYTLPMASAAVLGGVKIGSGITIDANGVISAEGGSAQEAKTIEISTSNPADFTEDDIDAMQDMVDYLAEFPADNLPAARIKNGGVYLILGSIDYVPEEDTEQQTEERYSYRFNYAEAWGDEGVDESQNTFIETFYLNAENVEESYIVYWDSSEKGADKLSSIEDFDEVGPLNGDVVAKMKAMYKGVRIDWGNIPFEDMTILEMGNLFIYAWNNDGTNTLTCSDGETEEYIVNDGDECNNLRDNDYNWVVYRDGDYVLIRLGDNGGSNVPFEESFISLNYCDAQLDDATVQSDGLYQFDDNSGIWQPLAKSIVINDYLDAGQDKVAEFYAMMKPYMEGDPKGWPFNLYYRTKFFGMNPTLAPLSTAWINDYQSFGNENLFFVFEYVGYAHDFNNSQAPDRRTIEIADDGSYDSNGWGGKTPSDLSVGYVWFGNDSRGRLTYDADNDRFEYDEGYIATGDTTTVYDDLIDNLMTDHLFTNELIEGNLECINFNLLYVVENGETTEYSYPLLSRRVLSTPVTIDSRDFYKEITYNYGDWKLTALYGADDGNNAANLRIVALP